MNQQIQERPRTWRFLIGSVIFLCAQAGFAGADDLSAFPFSGLSDYDGLGSGAQGELIVRFVDTDKLEPSGPAIVGPRTSRAMRNSISDYAVRGASVAREYDRVVPGLALVKLPKGTSVLDGVMRFSQSPNIRYAEPNYKYMFLRMPNDPNFSKQWGLHNTGQTGGRADADIDAPEAWDIQTGSKSVVVAIIDSGIDVKHPDLALNLWMNNKEVMGKPKVDDDGNGYVDDYIGYDFLDGDADPTDDFYHGTHVAGIIGAFGNNMMGIAGVCWTASMMPLRVGNKDGVKTSAAISAVEYATISGAKVINASWGGYQYSEGLRNAIEAAGKKGILFVAAAGNELNDNDSQPVYPASYDCDNIISVMATDANDRVSWSSNYGAASVDIGEPGENILSTFPTTATESMTTEGYKKSYETISGTSQAAAHVSGACALVWSQYPTLSSQIVKHILLQTAEPVLPGLCVSNGRVNLYEALTVLPKGKMGRVLNTRDKPNDPRVLHASIQAAIDKATDGDTLIAEGAADANMLFVEHIDFHGKKITIRSGNIRKPDDPTIYPETTFILGYSADGTVVTFSSGEGADTVLKGFTIGWGNADYGGGIRCDGTSPTISYCIINNNIAKYYGGGIDCYDASPKITNCVISSNRVFGKSAVGAGINCEGGSATIADCTISNNSSNNVGGGIGCYKTSPTIFNCLIINNLAVYGSGQIDLEDASPSITNCTIVVDKGNPAQDGGIVAYGDSSPAITNCILWGNGDDLDGCSATYSCIEDDDAGLGNIHSDPLFVKGPKGRYYLSQVAAGQLLGSPCVDTGDPSTSAGLLAQLRQYTTRTDGVTDANSPDIGAHYGAAPAKLCQLTVTVVDAAGKAVDPNKAGGRVDPNSGTYREYEVVRLRAYPKAGYRLKAWKGTDNDSSTDPNALVTILGETLVTVQFEQIPTYKLVTTVAGGHGTISPYHRRGEYYPDGTVVSLVASPDLGYIVDKWTGTDDDKSWSNLNIVTIKSDKEVTVKFRQPRSLHVPGQYRSIAQAMGDTYHHGDKVVVSPGRYNEYSLDFGGKAITLASEHPDDPCCVANTIIDCRRLGRAFIFQSGERTDSVVDGFTIQNGSAVYDANTATNTSGRGADGENGYGGAIACFKGSSPTLSNLVIKDCVARGRNGENASFVFTPYPAPAPAPTALPALDQLPDPNEPNWAPNDPNMPADPNAGLAGEDGQNGEDGAAGADGLKGQDGYAGGEGGHGYGGAMYFDANSAPIILHCTMTNCRAIGGNGGFGGQGQSGQNGQDGQAGQGGQEGQNGGPAVGDSPEGAGGKGGNGGNGGAGGKGGDGGASGDGGRGGEALGGSIYFGPNCKPTVRYCTIQNCLTRQGLGSAAGNAGDGGAGGNAGAGGEVGTGGGGEPPGEDGTAGTDGTGGNGGVGGKGASMGWNGNRSWGGAVYFGEKCTIEISDTVISYNATNMTVPTVAYAGGNGGAGGAGGSAGGNGGAGGAGGKGNPRATGGAGGAAGQNGMAGTNGAAGESDLSVTTSYGGGNIYEAGCKGTLVNCVISYNSAEDGDGGGEHHMRECEVVLNRCDLTGNSAGRDGGGQSFDQFCSATINSGSYLSNSAAIDGGGLYFWRDCKVDVNESTFGANSALGTYGSGGGLYGGGTWDDMRGDWYNGSTVKVRTSEFYGNRAAFGGGLYWYGDAAEVSVTDSIVRDNTAEFGGGFYWSSGAPTIANCSIRGNRAIGSQITVPAPIPPDPNDPNDQGDPNATRQVSTGSGSGAGVLCWSSSALIENCFISRNSVSGSGGGVYLGGDFSTPRLKNCLVKENSATIEGGGIVSNWYVTPTISNCTIVENSAADPSVANRGKGGGLSCSHESKTILIDSILWGNTGTQGTQIAIGSDSDPAYMQRPAVLTVSYCDIQGGRSAQAISVETGRTLDWLGGNISDDPLFVASYYLSQVEAGQRVDSPCVDAGSDTAANLGLDRLSTRLDGVFDWGVGDIGFHYTPVGRYTLTVYVVGGSGTVTPSGGVFHEYTVVTLRANPSAGYRVKRWSGTNLDPSWNRNTNTVTLDTGDKTVTVEFEPAMTRNLHVPAEYRTIEGAVAAASYGDTNIIISKGTHYVSNPEGIDLLRKSVTLTSTDPDDPDIVANTIIDCQGTRYVPKRAFHFHRGEDPNTVIAGLTIRNGFWVGAVGANGGIPGGPVNPGDQNSPLRAASGANANGIGYGGAILCENRSSPTIKNCVITDCTVAGAWGGDGNSGPPILGGSADGVWGGDGGDGNGTGYGGAIACLGGSCPVVTDCTIKNNFARGGGGGIGGNGSNPNQGSGRESWGGNGGYAIGDGIGGAIYCENASNAIVRNTTFIDNMATTGVPGGGGSPGPGAGLADPYPNPAGAGATGFAMTFGRIAGGAAYYANANPYFESCRFIDNSALIEYQYAFGPATQQYTRAGALYCGQNSTITLAKCEFTGNLGGGVYALGRDVIDFNECFFKNNQAVDPGGALYIGPACSSVNIRDCDFYSNSTTQDGGALNSDSGATLRNCSFAGNRAGGNGGGIDAYYDTGDPNSIVILTINMESCSFGGNQATESISGWGGAVHFQDVDATVNNCYFIGNTAKNGGGLFLAGGSVNLTGGIVSGNKAIGGSGIDTRPDPTLTGLGSLYYGHFGRVGAPLNYGAGVDIGGGLVCEGTQAAIKHCAFTDNVAGGVNGAGGAINFYGGGIEHAVKNCLFTGNSATASGGAVSCELFAKPVFENCTFGDDSAAKLGGALYCDWNSDVAVTNCIFQKCNKHAIAEVDFRNSAVKHSLFDKNSEGDYGIYDSVTMQTQTLSAADLDVTNLGVDPLFVAGPLGTHYLSQMAAGQAVDSPAVNGGSGFALPAGLSLYTTRTDGEGDSGVVDVGYHYLNHTGIPQYRLTASVAGGHGEISPTTGMYYAGTAVKLTAEPEKGWRVARWSGTNDDASKALTNLVVMGPDRSVAVEFGQPRTIVVGSDPNYTSIQHAIDAAADGDVVMIPAGTYSAVPAFTEILITGKNITLTGMNPDDPAVVAATVLRHYHFYIYDVGPETVIDGITIRGSYKWGADGVDGGVFDPDNDGYNGSSMQGGAMVIYNASPIIRNCVIADCNVWGGNGGNGAGGIQDVHSMGFDGGWAGWAYGGAVYCGYAGNPTFQNCSFTNCFARGGNGGNGGPGVQNAPGGRGGNWEWAPTIEAELPLLLWDGWAWGPYEQDGTPRLSMTGAAAGYYKGYWKYSGYGGAVYCENFSSPKFVDCKFTNNRAYGGVCGVGNTTSSLIGPDRNLKIENFGGAGYACYGSNPEFVGCVFTNNVADRSNNYITDRAANAVGTVARPDDLYISYGGALAFEDDCAPKLVDCTLARNEACIGGGIWWSKSDATIADSNFASNTAYHGGGLYSVEATGTITGATVERNTALIVPTDANDPNVAYDVPTLIYGRGGGYHCLASVVNITDSVFRQNEASGSGGGIYFVGSDQDMWFSPVLHNSLFSGNIAGRDGGAVSSNWYAEPRISNCSIVDNTVTGAIGYGGGLYCGYDSNTVVVDSILWGNKGVEGSQIAVGNGFTEYGPRPSHLKISYSDVQPSPDPNTLKPPDKLDIVFCIDTTGSMFDDIDAVKAASLQIINRIAAESSDFRIAVVDYRDMNEAPYGVPGVDYPYRDDLPFERDVTAIQTGINALDLGAGADWKESVYSGLMRCIDGTTLGGWRAGSDVARAIILIGDAPPHDPEPTTRYRIGDVIAAAQAGEPKSIFAIPVDGNPITAAMFSRLAEGSGGALIDASDANEVVGAIVEAIGLIWRPPVSLYVEKDCTVDWWSATNNRWGVGSHNIGKDPLFIADYYLSQMASGQLVQSPCVDTGSGSANAPNIALDMRTTRTDGVNDVNVVDMGYHHTKGLVQYRLTVRVIPDPNDGLIHGRVDPNVALVYEGFGSKVVTLRAIPNTGYNVKKWTGTDNDALTSRTNTVTVTKDMEVTVEFGPAPQYNFAALVVDRGDGPHGAVEPNFGQFYDGDTIALKATPDAGYEVRRWFGSDNDSSREPNNTVTINGADVVVGVEFGLIGQNRINLYNAFGVLDPRSPFITIQAAINASAANYEVVLSDGVYTGAGNYNIDLSAGLGPNDVRPITVRSENGAQNCIIDCEGLGRGFIFDSNEDPNYVLNGLTIMGGRAAFGGAILCDMASPRIINCRILDSTATGNGGGIFCTNSSSPEILNTEISRNSSGGFGGGIYAEATSAPEIINCLITFNRSADIGGSIFLADSPAVITLCTVAYNYGLSYGTTDEPYAKGGICARDSDPTITNCIIGRNGYYYYGVVPGTITGRWGDTLYVGDDLYGCDATYSCIENGDDGDGNIDGDPLWVTGPLGGFYLSQFAGGQRRQSPCIDAGEQFVMQTLQDTYDLGDITTSIVNMRDTGFGDMGYHHLFYQGQPIQYKLQINIVGKGRVTYTDANGVTVIVEPNKPAEVRSFVPGMMLLVTAVPDPGYRLFKWTGTDSDASTAPYNYVTMDSDRKVTVEFEKKVARTITVPGGFSTIQAALFAAREGDVVVVDPGRYYGGYLGFSLVVDKSITITSRNPHDPCTVEATIIDGYVGTNPWHNLGVEFTANADSNTVFNGFTIENCGGAWGDGDDGDRDQGHPNGEDGSPGEGAAMIMLPGAKPVIKNCVLRNNLVFGGDGGNGVGADDENNAGRGGWGGWARGGAVYCAPYSAPTFVNCRIEGNIVRGGNGGDGGDYADDGGMANYGGNWSRAQAYDFNPQGMGMEIVEGNLWEIWEWDYALTYSWLMFAPTAGGVIIDPNIIPGLYEKTSYFGDYRYYSGYGGGVFCDEKSKVTFISCEIRGNRAQGGMSGQGGVESAAGRNLEPLIPFEIPSYGGGVYCAAGTTVTFKGCTFEGNAASGTTAGVDPNHRLDPYVGYGGGVCAEGSALVRFVDCNFVDNEADTGGGLYVDDANATVTDCNVAANRALRGAGLASFGGSFSVIGSDITNNEATSDPNDPNDDYVLSAGAGLCLLSTDADVRDCNVSGNIADSSGGGMYLRGGNSSYIVNCLVKNNGAGRDGGGISTNWYAQPVVANCTFVGNAAAGTSGEPNNTGFGGALFCAYESSCVVKDSIFWKNYGMKGSEIAVGSGFELDPRCGTVSVSYSDIISSPNDVWVDKGCTLNRGSGIINKDPLFAAGPLGDYYLSNTGAGQGRTSPCVDAGSDQSGNVGMSAYTTRTDEMPDTGRVDMGYHYLFLEPCKYCDLVFDGIIKFNDFAVFASKWLNQGCSQTNGWCEGADFTFDSKVTMKDLAAFAECWLVEDTSPPIPDPSQWKTEPYLASSTVVEMAAKESLDAWGWDVEYYFDCVHGKCHDSAWQKSNVYRDTGLTSGAQYGYRVKARDGLGNETGLSVVRYAGADDTSAPAPAPHIQSIAATSSSAVTITATTSFDPSGVEYFFDANTPGAHDSGWQDLPVYADSNLSPNTTYCYRVRARDKSASQNETVWSVYVCATTQIPADLTPPTPNPMTWDTVADANGFDGRPREVQRGTGTFDYYATMRATTATDASGGIQYNFECIDRPELSSGWQASNTYTVQVGRRAQGLRWRVRAEDALGNKTDPSPALSAQ